MWGLIARRLVSLIPILFLVSTAVFFLVELVPGDAATTLAGGADATPERIAEVREELELDRPLLERYTTWLGDAVQLDFGNSLLSSSGPPISEEIANRFPVTLSIALGGVLVSVLLGVPLGVLSAVRPGGAVDRVSVTLTSLGLAIPSFVLGLFLITTFAIDRDWFPAVGYTPFGEDPLEWLRSITLPSIAIGLFVAASVARQVRAAMVDALQSNYVRTALAVGMGTTKTVMKYALKNAAIPAVTVLGLQLSALLGGTVILERIFQIQGGMGTYMFRALSAPDVPVIQAVTLTFVVTHVLINLIVDISYGYLNPKVRVS